jgi:CRP/FNR family transcriptional regulator
MKVATLEIIERFFSAYPLKRYNKGHILILPGETSENAYYLIQGKIKIYDVTYRGDEIIITNFKEPTFFPIALIINGGPTRYIYEAETDIVIRQAPAKDAVHFLDKHANVVLELLSNLYENFDNVLERMVLAIAGSAKNRLLYALLNECHEFGQRNGDGSVRLSINEKDLAAKAGLSRETVSREAKSLKAANFIEIHHSYMIIPDMSAFEKYVEKSLA